VPSLVFFLDAMSECVRRIGLRAGDGDGYGEGREDPEVRAGAFRKPSGSFRRLARRRTEPVVVISIFHGKAGDVRSKETGYAPGTS
jgi:hypothetical protein